MQEGRKLVLAVICSLVLCIEVAAEIPSDMAPDAVDDMYEGCTKNALKKFVLSDLLQEELNDSVVFQKAWDLALSSACPKVIQGGLKQHSTALRTMASDEGTFREQLNNAVYTLGTNITTYENHFHFKSFHFLLMDSIRLLNPVPPTCPTVYSFSDLKFNVPKGSTVRLGQFWIGYPSLEILKKARDIDDEHILSITTCFFANLGDNICNEEPMFLLSPAEEFTVEDFRHVKEEDDLSYHMTVLKHSRLKSTHNCYSFSRSPGISSHWIFLALLIPSFYIITS
ncbi:ecto-ADP-ribosyltransferase 4 [Eucyclogobius newberryi]|uniref:ecto-ADP-ribosyltransferase 4 n=1 Tax=Eucyclogobius newberryi TaxID=166745 RepID=UPI003B5BD728